MKDIRKLFIETPVFDDSHKDTFSDIEIKKPKGTFRFTEKINSDLSADFYDVALKKYYKIVIRKEQEVIGMIELEYTTNKVVLFPKIIGIAVRVPHRGKGYSKIFYEWLINRFGGVISDESLTGEDGHGSFQLWQWISKKYPTYIWKSKETAIIPIQGGITDKMMGGRKDHFMSSKEPIDFKAYNNMFARTFRMPSYADTKKVAAMTEMPAFQDVHLNMGRKKDYDDAINNDAYEEAQHEGELLDKKSLLNYSLELYKTWKMSDYRCDVFVINKENNEIVGRLISHLGSEGDYPIIASTVVYKKHQKQGLGMLMYTMLIENLGGCYSDRTLTGEYGGGSFRVWELLGQKYNSYTVSRDKKAKRNIIVKANGFSQDMMGDPDEKFLVTKDPIPEEKLSDPNKELAAMTEMPEFSDKDKVLGDDESFLPPLHATLVKTFGVDIPGAGKGKAELYRFISNLEEKELLLYMPNGEGCAVMQYDATKDSDMPFPVISFCAVKESYRGKGLSKILYDFIIKLHKGIISDATLTGEDRYGSFQVWQSLNKKYKTYIVNTVNGIIKPLPVITREHMGDHNERFMVTLHSFDYVRHNEGKSLKEVQLMNHSGDHDIDSSDPNEWDFVSGKTLINKKIGKDMIFIKMKVQHNSDVKYAIKDIKNKVIITGMRAKIDSGDFKVNPNEAQITSVVTNPNYRGKGWGKLMYKLVLETEGIIVSDYQLYPGTYAIWKDYLPKIANVYNFNEDGELEPFDPVKGISKEGLYDYFVASKKKLL